MRESATQPFKGRVCGIFAAISTETSSILTRFVVSAFEMAVPMLSQNHWKLILCIIGHKNPYKTPPIVAPAMINKAMKEKRCAENFTTVLYFPWPIL